MVKAKRAGNSRAAAAERRLLFVEKYCENGGNGRKAFKAAGYSARTAKTMDVEVYRLLRRPEVAKAIAERRAATLEAARDKTQLTADEVLRSLARDVRFDPAKLFDENGVMRPISEMDEDTRLALRGTKVYEEYHGRGEDREKIGETVEVKFPEKTAAREQAMKHFGLYERDNLQKPAATVNVGLLTVGLEFEKVRARAKALPAA